MQFRGPKTILNKAYYVLRRLKKWPRKAKNPHKLHFLNNLHMSIDTLAWKGIKGYLFLVTQSQLYYIIYYNIAFVNSERIEISRFSNLKMFYICYFSFSLYILPSFIHVFVQLLQYSYKWLQQIKSTPYVFTAIC